MITLQADEKILMEVRKHWLGICIHALVLFVLAIAPVIAVIVVLPYIFPDISGYTYIFFGALWLWFVWVMFFVMWTNYYLDVLVITNKRLIDMEQFVLFSRDEVVVPLEQIEDVKIEVFGFLATILRYGNLQIQSAGAARETIATNIIHPGAVRACLEAAVENQKRRV